MPRVPPGAPLEMRQDGGPGWLGPVQWGWGQYSRAGANRATHLWATCLCPSTTAPTYLESCAAHAGCLIHCQCGPHRFRSDYTLITRQRGLNYLTIVTYNHPQPHKLDSFETFSGPSIKAWSTWPVIVTGVSPGLIRWRLARRGRQRPAGTDCCVLHQISNG